MVASYDLSGKNDDLHATRVGHYLFTSRLHEGGMGYIYSGVHVHLNRHVAIKTARRDTPNHKFLQKRLISEARYLAAVDHVNVVTVHDMGVSPTGLAYVVMELLDGTSLDKIIDRDGPLRVPLALQVVREIARGLAAFHAQDIICADVKPDNVMVVSGPLVGRGLSRTSWIKLIDLGAARQMQMLNPLAEAEPTMGTSWYMSPEAVLGQDLDERADIYSLAVLLYEAIVGRVPFLDHDDEEIFRMHLWETAPRLSDTRPDIRPSSLLDNLVAACLEKAPGARPCSMYELLDALDEADREWRDAHPPRPGSDDLSVVIPPLRAQMTDEKEFDR